MPGYYAAPIPQFLTDDSDLIIGRLTTQAGNAGFYQQLHSQTASWEQQIRVLKSTLSEMLAHGWIKSGNILFEYPIPRRGKRIDTVLLLGELIFVLEFKCGHDHFPREATIQAEDYCLDLRDFHLQSSGRILVPVVVATDAPTRLIMPIDPADPVKSCRHTNSINLGTILVDIFNTFSRPDAQPIALNSWDTSDYRPTPTIIEAAQTLYACKNVREISQCQAGVDNLTKTTDAVLAAIQNSLDQNFKTICFVTGVPGAGKTLAGLNIIHSTDVHTNRLGCFLSGNSPLVRVLNEALARDHSIRANCSVRDSRGKVSTFIQNVHRFIDAYYADRQKLPVDRVVVFDEAQRAWDANQSKLKFKRTESEPEIILEIMNRRVGGAVIIALVGMGQEINRGEAGLREWGRALINRFQDWHVFVSPELCVGSNTTMNQLFDETPASISITTQPDLHLNVSLRSYRADSLNEFVNAILEFDSDRAARQFQKIPKFPIVLCRDLNAAKTWLKHQQRGNRRTGLVASSGARRLRPYGLDVTSDLEVENWFLNEPTDVRSSSYLEIPATEFGIQGLELDWVGLCWDLDLCPGPKGWQFQAFRGTAWERVQNQTKQQYILNKYRVLLTRSREGMVIWVPEGSQDDPTRPQNAYNQIEDFLKKCGIPTIAFGPR